MGPVIGRLQEASLHVPCEDAFDRWPLCGDHLKGRRLHPSSYVRHRRLDRARLSLRSNWRLRDNRRDRTRRRECRWGRNIQLLVGVHGRKLVDRRHGPRGPEVCRETIKDALELRLDRLIDAGNEDLRRRGPQPVGLLVVLRGDPRVPIRLLVDQVAIMLDTVTRAPLLEEQPRVLVTRRDGPRVQPVVDHVAERWAPVATQSADER